MNGVFDSVRVRRPKRNKFDLSHERKLTLNMGWLYPILCLETLPGDKFRVQTEVFLRFLALIAPVMHRVDVFVHYFFVPNRLLWSNWESFITQGEDGLQQPVPPTWDFKYLYDNSLGGERVKTGSLLDYLGFPVIKTADTYNTGYNTKPRAYSMLPLRAYLLIYDQVYRNQNVEVSQLPAGFKSDGDQVGGDLLACSFIRPRAWEKGYLTGALPWTQRGNPVSIPITSNVVYRASSLLRETGTSNLQAGGPMQTDALGSGKIQGGATGTDSYVDNIASVSSASLTVNALRASVRLQEWLERNALGGGRYIEQIAIHFGVVSSDARLQRVEYLGGGRQPVVISEVLQTTPVSGGSTPLATMAGHGLSVGGSNTFHKFFEEHGIVMGILSVMPRVAYVQHLPRLWTRLINTDYYFPEFAHLGEQSMQGREVYCNYADGAAGSLAAFDGTFGYQSRYAEYKYHETLVSGQMRESLAYWALHRSFTQAPTLNTTFIYGGASVRSDIFAVAGDTHHLVCQLLHRISALRPIPYYSTPRL